MSARARSGDRGMTRDRSGGKAGVALAFGPKTETLQSRAHSIDTLKARVGGLAENKRKDDRQVWV